MERLKISRCFAILLCLIPVIRADINRTGCNRTVEAGDVLANPLLTGFNKGRPYNCWFLVSFPYYIITFVFIRRAPALLCVDCSRTNSALKARQEEKRFLFMSIVLTTVWMPVYFTHFDDRTFATVIGETPCQQCTKRCRPGHCPKVSTFPMGPARQRYNVHRRSLTGTSPLRPPRL